MFKLIFNLGGWKITHYLPSHIKKCVIVAAPHTSNWDFIYGMGALKYMQLNLRFVIIVIPAPKQIPNKNLFLLTGSFT